MGDLAGLIAGLARAGVAIGPALRPAASVAAKSMEETWRGIFPWSGSTHLPHMPGLIRSEVTTGALAVEAQAWVDKTGQGNLAHLIEYGGPYNGAHPGGAPALAQAAGPFALAVAVTGATVLNSI
jgi:hypothetical protein